MNRIRRSVIALGVLVLFASWLATSTPPVEIAAQTTNAPVTDRRSPLLAVDDLKDPKGLGEDLRRHADPLSEYLWTRLSPRARDLVEQSLRGSTAPNIGRTLTDELNPLLEGSSLYDPRRFAGIKLRRQTSRLIERSPTGADLVRLNRALLEDAYPTRIARVPPVLIFDEDADHHIAVVGVIGAVAGGVVGGIMGLLEGAVVGAAVGGVVSASVANWIHHWQQGDVPAVQSSLPRTALD